MYNVRVSFSASTLLVRHGVLIPCMSFTVVLRHAEWQEGNLAHTNPLVVPVNLSFVRASARLGYLDQRVIM